MAGKRGRHARRGIGGLHIDHAVNASKLLDACPVYFPGVKKGKGSCAIGFSDSGKTTQHLIKVSIAARTMRQKIQASQSVGITWLFELASISTKIPVSPPKRYEMSEADAFRKNKHILDLDLYWRRAPY